MEPDKKDIMSILNFLYEKTIEDGGDGEAIWLTKFYKLEDIAKIINSEYQTDWKVEFNYNYIYWGNDQESVVITNNNVIYDNKRNVELRLELH
jgi:hypothetical protein